MQEIKDIATVFRGLQITKYERLKIYADEKNASEAVILNYDNISSYTEKIILKDTIDFNYYDNAEKVYIDLNKKYKNVGIKKNDIILPVKLKNHIAKFVTFEKLELRKNYIYSNDLLIIRPDETKVNSKFLFLILSTEYVKEKLDKESINYKQQHRITCEMINKLKVKLPNMEEQEKIISEIERINLEKAQLEKSFENLIK